MQMTETLPRGTYFAEHSHPNVTGKVIVEESHSYPGVGHAFLLAEKASSGEHEGKWFAYWQPAQQLYDEISLEACEQTHTLSDEQMEQVEEQIFIDEPSSPDAPKGIDDVRRVRDVTPSFTDYHQIDG